MSELSSGSLPRFELELGSSSSIELRSGSSLFALEGSDSLSKVALELPPKIPLALNQELELPSSQPHETDHHPQTHPQVASGTSSAEPNLAEPAQGLLA
jgi:hypothetical protein